MLKYLVSESVSSFRRSKFLPLLAVGAIIAFVFLFPEFMNQNTAIPRSMAKPVTFALYGLVGIFVLWDMVESIRVEWPRIVHRAKSQKDQADNIRRWG